MKSIDCPFQLAYESKFYADKSMKLARMAMEMARMVREIFNICNKWRLTA